MLVVRNVTHGEVLGPWISSEARRPELPHQITHYNYRDARGNIRSVLWAISEVIDIDAELDKLNKEMQFLREAQANG